MRVTQMLEEFWKILHGLNVLNALLNLLLLKCGQILESYFVHGVMEKVALKHS